MYCPKCGSSNVRVRNAVKKSPIILCFIGIFGGLGLMVLGVIGALTGSVFGVVIGLVVRELMQTTYKGVCVCQNCGYVAYMPGKRSCNINGHPLFSTYNGSNFVIVRDSSETGKAVLLTITIDNFAPFCLQNDISIPLLLPYGNHTLTFTQREGAQKGKRSGRITIYADGSKRTIRFVFTAYGISIT